MPCVPRDLLLSPYDRLGASIFIHRIAVRKSEIHALTTNIAANLNYLFDYFGSIIVMLGSADFFTQLMLSTLQEKDGKVVVPSIGLAIDGRFSVEKEPMICANGLKNVSRENVNLGEKTFW